MEKQEFKDIWLPLSDRFYRVAYSILGSEPDARDALQDLYVRLWNQRGSLENIESPAAYGTRILRNICIDRIRSRRNGEPALEIETVVRDTASGGPLSPSADRVVIDKEMIRCLSRAMESLPLMQKQVMEMKFFRQMSYDEIVGRTGISPVNVRVLVSRARKTVLAAMKEFIR